MAEGSESHPNESTDDQEVVVTSKKGQDPASSPKGNGKTLYDMLTSIYQVPFLGLAEEHLWRTRAAEKKERRECLYEFKKERPRLYKAVFIADLFILTILLLIVLSVIALVAYLGIQKAIGS